MAREVNFPAECPVCHEDITITAEVEPIQTAPEIRAEKVGVKPVGSIFVYKITSDQMKQFITNKIKSEISDIKIDVVPCYTEKRKQKSNDPHKAYASLRIAFSEEGLETKTEDLGWFGRIGRNSTNMEYKTILKKLIDRYKYNRKEVEKWLDDYKTLERLEENLGINEKFINELLMYCTPQRIVSTNNQSWIIFAAAAENVIADMLKDYKTKKPVGRIQIADVFQISKDVVEFIVYLHPSEVKMKEDPHVRKILMGEEKARRI